jgi:hypothetical protein
VHTSHLRWSVGDDPEMGQARTIAQAPQSGATRTVQKQDSAASGQGPEHKPELPVQVAIGDQPLSRDALAAPHRSFYSDL